ncbi:protein STRUBBELIG-RECEPTOR FAMILY 5-like isoform X2 [Aristolochia californica]|uniref:protein STRUBBELIG-RECEPTOR FAMILY 5-like isoform X2 n=1 Tax=Aristolochia californica TaxID=171875 RepID=UPI0035D60F38
MMDRIFLGFCSLLLVFFIPADGKTQALDVSALQVMYNSLNSPSQLTGWRASGGDPCGEDWKGITCSGSSVTEIKLSGLGLTGSMGYQLSSLTSVTYFDLSKNNLQGDIPYQLPPNAIHINLALNSFTGGIPYSTSQMSDLEYLNLGNNQLSGQLSDMFGQLSKLNMLDLSFNSLSGNLPKSFASLSSLETMRLQNNQFKGPINVLENLPLQELNVADNKFSGWIPDKMKNIDDLETEGNAWSAGPAPPGSEREKDHQGHTSHGRISKQAAKGGVIAAIVVSVLALAVILLVLFARKSSSSHSSQFLDEEKISQNRPFTPLVSQELDADSSEHSASIDINSLPKADSLNLKPPPSDRLKSFEDTDIDSKFNSSKSVDSVAATTYSLGDLQEATTNFAESCLVGEGSIGCVYKAKFSDGKVLAVKKIDSESNQDFIEVVSSISKLRHPNITEILGYCSERGYRLLVYDFMRNGSLYNFLHLSDDYSKPLTWNTRIKIALGVARALEYLHEGCSPSAVHTNIKSANILLDTELKPHLCGCGFATFFSECSLKDDVEGYSAPECTKQSAHTSKSDVYSFGVVMLELLTGRKPFDSSKAKAEQYLVQWATPQLHDIDALDKMVDPALRGLYPPKSLSRFADIIALCVQVEPEFRPAMSDVVQSLVRSQRG